MKLKYFRIKNYKSIIDSGRCDLSSSDNITVLAGQNESGKSSLLRALYDFYKGSLQKDSIRLNEDEQFPSIEWQFYLENTDKTPIKSYFEESKILQSFFLGFKEIVIERSFISVTEYETKIPKSKTSHLLEFLLGQLKDSTKRITNEVVNTLITEIDNCTIYAEDDNEAEAESYDSLYQQLEITFERLLSQFAEYLLENCSPKVIFFDDFCDLLPDEISIESLMQRKKSNGYQAVKNVENILKTDFTTLDTLSDIKRKQSQHKNAGELTANFNDRWKQRISIENGTRIHIEHYQGKAESASYLKFYIESKPGEYLNPSQRSQGFKWFLSFYLHLTAESNRNESLIILFDEPGLHLHAKAQSDMISVFEELSQKHQIIYSTHSSHLINPKKLHRVRLVLNSEAAGTTVEKITTNKAVNKKDALRPIIDAIGLDIAHNFSAVNRENVILEGISDFYYFTAMKKLLDPDSDYHFIPSMGVSQVHLLMELCIGWGLNWVIVFDKKDSTREYNKIKKQFFLNDDSKARKKIYTLVGCDGIEDAFHYEDFRQVLPELKNPDTTSLSIIAEENGGKELFGRLFLSKVEANEITKETLHPSTVSKFEEVLSNVKAMLTESY
ncbi:ATP-dependent nuclease [Pontibacter indicus]|uniref:Predicted ATP-dependent endonuclease of the OLD family, contains P-loop ATPase and TOPRIM domains n=1 Tax=Pontibacter indicus TaxID=1317125 RepID=A0A1R3XJ01_9BACT|nr:AAA family ATPase [Pontibacter indicus]SIT91577.1 Predicted ATP-dependent endonuclease of the OLD family, contains P-loop ATPase and TOPRIM domains [Pontibacter indicus]